MLLSPATPATRSTLATTSHSPGGLENRRSWGRVICPVNAEGAPVRAPTHVKDTPAATGDAP
jgi:hypothetical protein